MLNPDRLKQDRLLKYHVLPCLHYMVKFRRELYYILKNRVKCVFQGVALLIF